METTTRNNWAIPAAIVIAGALIAASLYWSRTERPVVEDNTANDDLSQLAEDAVKILPTDHIRGNKEAKVKFITYTDMECPFCKMFHQTINQAVKDYGNNVAFVYRNFPIQSIHPKAVTEAVAAECVADLAGEEAYWKFVDRFFEVTPSNNQTDLSVLNQIAVAVGANDAEFRNCVSGEQYTDLINEHFNQALKTGAKGTPWTLVVTKKGRVLSIDGAQDYPIVKQIIETALND